MRNSLQNNEGMPKFITIHGKRYSSEDGSLKLSSTYQDDGADTLGSWMASYYIYNAVGTNITYTTFLKNYNDLPVTIAGQVTR